MHHILCKSWEKYDRDIGNDRASVLEETMSSTWIIEWYAWFKAGQTSLDNNKHTGRPISSATPDIVKKFSSLFMRIDLADEMSLVVRLANGV